MAKCGAGRTLEVSGEGLHAEKRARWSIESRTHKHTHAIYPGSGPSCGGNTPTPASLSMYMGEAQAQVQDLLLELCSRL